jgi:hypothetical protein
MKLAAMEAKATPTRSAGVGVWYRPVMLGLALIVLMIGLILSWAHLRAYTDRDIIGVDYRLFAELGRRWTEDASMYASWQFAPYRFDQGSGTNDVASMPGLYPPPAGPVFAVVGALPPILWWIVPLSIVGVSLARWRPAPWAWPLLAAVTLSPNLVGVLATGGSTMWVAAGVAAGFAYRWPVVIILLKPTFAPFLLLGVGRRSFWIGGVAPVVIVSLLMLPEWGRWFEVLRNTESPGLLYSLHDLPLIAVPVVGWLARTSRGNRAVTRQPRMKANGRAALMPASDAPPVSAAHLLASTRSSHQSEVLEAG